MTYSVGSWNRPWNGNTLDFSTNSIFNYWDKNHIENPCRTFPYKMRTLRQNGKPTNLYQGNFCPFNRSDFFRASRDWFIIFISPRMAHCLASLPEAMRLGLWENVRKILPETTDGVCRGGFALAAGSIMDHSMGSIRDHRLKSGNLGKIWGRLKCRWHLENP